MTAKQLTDSILQMAIQGKLVPQDPNDEPASVLLERIREEKRRLVKEGKLKKKDLEETPINEDEVPFKIPESWEWVRLGNIISLLSGRDLSPQDYNDSENGIPYITGASNFLNEGLLINRWTPKAITISKRGDLLITCKGTIGTMAYNQIGDIHIARQVMAINTYLISLDYIKYFLTRQVYEFGKKAKSIIPGISREDVLESFFPLPPLAEQHRIVERIEELLPIIKEYGEAYEEASKMDAELPDKLKKSILQDAIMGKLDTQDPNDEPASVLLEQIREEKKKLVKEGKLKKKDLEETPVEESEQPFKIPESWEWCRVEDYANKVTDFVASGSFATLRENVKYYKEENYALLVKTKDFQTNFNRDLTFTDKHGYEFLANSNLFGGELILSNVGSIGKIFIVPKLNRKMSLAPNAIMVRFWNEEHRDWLYYLFQSPFGLALLYEISSATAIRKFNKTDFKKLTIPLPPLAEQHRIVEKIEALFAEIDNMTINDITTNEEETKETETE